MTVAAPKTSTQSRMTLAEFLTYDDGSENRYELVDGVLVEMGNEAKINTKIAMYLIAMLIGLDIPHYRLGIKQKIQVNSDYASARDPDLIIHTEASATVGADDLEFCLRLDQPNPMIVVEITSPGEPGTPNYDRDYGHKRDEYAARGIPEYWIIDPDRQWVKVGTWVSGTYDFQTFMGEEAIASPSLQNWTLRAKQVLTAGREDG
jgi:Uma2 family endonuclease